MTAGGEPLFGPYSIRRLQDDEFEPLLQTYGSVVFADTWDFHLYQAFSAEEHAAAERLRARLGTPFRLNLGIYCGEEFVGWSWGIQESLQRFDMINTGLLAEHRNRGIYSALLPHLLDLLRAEGFQVAFSHHTMTNNQVLVPKLRAGFVITGFELIDRFGMLVNLSYFFNPLRRKVLDVRAGQARPDAEVLKYMPIE
jgi:GNAT superfamily N-acetyltransferase